MLQHLGVEGPHLLRAQVVLYQGGVVKDGDAAVGSHPGVMNRHHWAAWDHTEGAATQVDAKRRVLGGRGKGW